MNTTNNNAIAALGDSVTRGYDGFHNLKYNYPYYLSQQLRIPVDNWGINGATIWSDLATEIAEIQHHSYNTIIIMIGTNDYGHNNVNLNQVTTRFFNLLAQLKQDHPDANIYGILPLPRYDHQQNASEVVRLADYTFNNLLNALYQVYTAQQIPVLDWRQSCPEFITDNNYMDRYQDQHVHPTAQTYRQLAQYINNFMNNNKKRG
jgi:lysophospholipase L1-like esterase